MKNFEYMSYILFMVSMFGYAINKKHVMNMLIMLEFMMLSVVVLMCVNGGLVIPEWMIMMMIFFMVCDSVVGMSGVVMISRSHGKDEMLNMNLLLC